MNLENLNQNTSMKPFALLLVFAMATPLLLLERAQAQDTGLPSLVVAPMTAKDGYISGWQPALGRGLSEMLITELSKLNKFQVLESTHLEALLDEIGLGEQGLIAEDEKVERGEFAGADFVFVGNVTRFGSQEQQTDLGGFVPRSIGRFGLRQTTSEVRIDWRIVDAATRRIIGSGSADGVHKGGGFDIGVRVDGRGGNVGFNNREFMDSALGKATVQALSQIVNRVAAANVPVSGRVKARLASQNREQAGAEARLQQLRATPGKVLAVVNDTTLVVSLGSEHGFQSGDQLALFQTIEIKDGEGNVVFVDEQLAGEVVLNRVQEDRSLASYTSKLAVEPGWKVQVK
jgi:curli biogenesis system outer membrane secretion channel CsgG